MNQIQNANMSLEEVITNSTDDRLQQDVRFMNQIGEELGQVCFQLAPTPQIFSPQYGMPTESSRGTVYKLDFRGGNSQIQKNNKATEKQATRQSKLQLRIDQMRKKKNGKKKKLESLSIQNYKTDNITPKRETNS